jgi:hypothetical protein
VGSKAVILCGWQLFRVMWRGEKVGGPGIQAHMIDHDRAMDACGSTTAEEQRLAISPLLMLLVSLHGPAVKRSHAHSGRPLANLRTFS